jgi:serine/threonine-protein kinase
MSQDPRPDGGKMPPAQLRRVIVACERYEGDWHAGRRPRIEQFLADDPGPDRPALLRELLALELELRRDAGEQPGPQEYRARFPEHGAAVADAFDMTSRSAECDRDAATGPKGNNDPTVSRDGRDTGPDDLDATLTYSVGRDGGQIGPWIDADQRQRLRDTFAVGGVIQSRYRIDRELGRGGMGIVFLGRDLRLDRPIAIKVILLNGRTQDAARLAALRDGFAEEARLGANLTHPAIASVYDYGFQDGKPFTVFEYLPGETLRDLLRRRGRLPLEEVRLIIGPLAQALDFAHARRVVHRDLKPDNVRATEQGLLKVLDLGLAREFGRDVDWSGFAGTPAYASPEQASGLPCDGRADQYALALMAFELLTGHRLFRARDPRDLLAMHRETQPAALATDLADVPEAVRLALACALSKAPNARFATCVEFAVALGSQLLHAPVPPAEVVCEADIRRMAVGRLGRRISPGWFDSTVHLVLTREALWSAYHTEICRWPLDAVERLEPQVAPIEERTEEKVGDAEVVRRMHQETESTIRAIAKLHVLMAILVAVAFATLVIATARGGRDSWTGARIIAMGLLTALSGGSYAVGRGLWRHRPWARWATLAVAAAILLLTTAGLITALVGAWPSGNLWRVATLGGLLSLILAPIAYAAFVLGSRKGSVVCSESYQSVIEETSHLDPLTGFDLTTGICTLRLKLRGSEGTSSRVSFRFATARECKHWAGLLAALLEQRSTPPGIPAEIPLLAPVVLMRQRPMLRYQLLGVLEAKAEKRRVAEAGLQVRAAIMGADAVIDVQEEHLPDFSRTLRTLTGTAVRAVDPQGRFEFRSRWYADRASRTCAWVFVLLVVSFLSQMFVGVFHTAMFPQRLGILTSEVSPAGLPQQLFVLALIVAAIHAWPLGLTVLVRALRWPQLVLPLALTVVGFGLGPLYLLAGAILAAVWTANWSGLASLLFGPINPMSTMLALVLPSLFLGRNAWQSAREYRLLVPEGERQAPLSRTLGGRLALIASLFFAAALAGSLVWTGFVDTSRFRWSDSSRASRRATATPSRTTWMSSSPCARGSRSIGSTAAESIAVSGGMRRWTSGGGGNRKSAPPVSSAHPEFAASAYAAATRLQALTPLSA